MAGSKYLSTNKLDGATVTATSTATGSAVANLYAYRPSRTYTSGSTTAGQRINMDFGSAVTLDTIALINHNLPSAGQYKLEKSASGAWAGEQVHVKTITYRAENMYADGFSESSRYWSLWLQDSDGAGGNFATAPKIGELSAGESVQFTRQFIVGAPFSSIQRNITHLTPAGHAWMAHINSGRSWGVSYRDVTEANRVEIETMHTATAGAARPFTLRARR